MRIIATLALIVICFPTSGQKASGNGRDGRKEIVHDVYRGNIDNLSGKVETCLILEHAGQFVDDGQFILVEGKMTTKGDWSVLRGDAKDHNATVVELYNTQRSVYFLRRKDGALQKLDSQLMELKPVDNFLLRKVGK